MSKYKIIADYDIYDISSQKQDGTITIKIPFKNENGSLQYGVEKILSDLEKNKIYPTEDGFDILALAELVYLADTRISRIKHAEDSCLLYTSPSPRDA